MDPLRFIKTLTERAAIYCSSLNDTFSAQVREANPQFGDYQSNGLLAFAKRNNANAMDLAEQLLEAIQKLIEKDRIPLSVEVVAPGFINFVLQPAFIEDRISDFFTLEGIRKLVKDPQPPQQIVFDYSSPNSAKQMHVGHIRSTVIGESLARIFSFTGSSVIRDNHIGDWGTQFGILLMQIKSIQFDIMCKDTNLDHLEDLYRQGNTRFQQDPFVKKEVYKELKKLQKGDPENVAIWDRINKISYSSFQNIYDILGVSFDHLLGESFYCHQLERVYKELVEENIAEESQGALVVFHPEHNRFKTVPFIVRKSDQTSNYASTDLATILYRVERFQSQKIIYVTDSRQKDHFQQLFKTTEKWFQSKKYYQPQLEHVTFGSILGEDGKAIKTRSGEPIRLENLLKEAVDRAFKLVTQKNPDLGEVERNEIARVVGVGSVKYADLMQNRKSDYVFSWEKMISFDGNTAPYLLYTVARIYSIFRNASIPIDSFEISSISLYNQSEISLAKKIIPFQSVMRQVRADLYPHLIANFLYDLASAYNSFYKKCQVLHSDERTRKRRLALSLATLNTLTTGLDLLGIETLEKM